MDNHFKSDHQINQEKIYSIRHDFEKVVKAIQLTVTLSLGIVYLCFFLNGNHFKIQTPDLHKKKLPSTK
jgi:sugar phosphate permease